MAGPMGFKDYEQNTRGSSDMGGSGAGGGVAEAIGSIVGEGIKAEQGSDNISKQMRVPKEVRASTTMDAKWKYLRNRLAGTDSAILGNMQAQGLSNYMGATGNYGQGTYQREQQDEWDATKGGMRGMLAAQRNAPQGISAQQSAMNFKNASKTGQPVPVQEKTDYGQAWDEGYDEVVAEQKFAKANPSLQELQGMVGQLLPAIEFIKYFVSGSGEPKDSALSDSITRLDDSIAVGLKEGPVAMIASILSMGSSTKDENSIYTAFKNSKFGKNIAEGRDTRQKNFSNLFKG